MYIFLHAVCFHHLTLPARKACSSFRSPFCADMLAVLTGLRSVATVKGTSVLPRTLAFCAASGDSVVRVLRMLSNWRSSWRRTKSTEWACKGNTSHPHLHQPDYDRRNQAAHTADCCSRQTVNHERKAHLSHVPYATKVCHASMGAARNGGC